MIESHQQTCKACGRADKFDYTVPDEIWHKALPERLWNRVVCLSCFDDFAANADVDYAPVLDEVYFAGRAATFRFRKEWHCR